MLHRTTDPAETTLPSPIVTPGRMMHPVPIRTLSSMITGRTSSSKGGRPASLRAGSTGCPLESTTRACEAILQWLPMVTLLPTANEHKCPIPTLLPILSVGRSLKRARS